MIRCPSLNERRNVEENSSQTVARDARKESLRVGKSET